MNDWAALFRLAERHRGVVTPAMARSVGIPDATLHRRAGAEGWPRIFRGARRLPGVPDGHEVRVMAGLLLVGDRSAASHESALFLLGLRSQPPSEVTLSVPVDVNRGSRQGLRVVRSSTLRRSDVEVREGVRLTAAPRTLRDVAATRTDLELLDLATAAEQRRLTTLPRLEGVAARQDPAAGAARFRRIVTQRRVDRSDSGLERDTRILCVGHGFRPHPAPFPVRCRDRRLIHLDVPFPDIWFAFECDGLGFHMDDASFERDRLRWRMAQKEGWRLGWVTRRRLLRDAAGIIEELHDAYRNADRSRPPAAPAV